MPRGAEPIRLPAPTADTAALLRPPLLPAAAAARVPLACRAAAARLPVLLSAPAGSRLRLARALHASAGHAGPLFAVAGRRPRLDGLPAGAALYVDDVGALAPEAVLALQVLLDDGALWLLAGAAPDARLAPAVATRLAAITLDVPALAARAAELPGLGAALLGSLADRLGRPPPRLSDAAVAHLVARPWPGDLGELEGVLARAMLLTAGATLEVEHLLGTAAAADPPAEPPAVSVGAQLEFMLAELAHELRNPMVTIKTFARHLPEMLHDAELRDRFARLSDEAIARMDGVLENMLTFARLGEPAVRVFDVGALLERTLAEVGPELAERAVRVRQGTIPAAAGAGDPEQLGYALRNLFAGIVREVPAREEVALDASANGVVTLRFAAGGEAAERLRRLMAPPQSDDTTTEAATLADPTLLPLSFRLARAVLERNGGTLAVAPGGGETTTVVVRLPTAGVEG
jgi:signal transduction histidine kinase